MRLLLAVVLVLAAAAPAAAQEPGPGEAPDPAIADGSAQRALDAAKARWRARGSLSYTHEVRLSCFCAPSGFERITLRGGKLGKVPRGLADVATIPRQFRLVQRAIDQGVVDLTVRYGTRGNPLQVSIDRSRRIADEESYYTMRRLTLRSI
ncbi:MAG: hypothetical protein JWO90_276 [Solirubrobacterales bacterium]|jgi:hypothetical protein|nr:hypothetical protein [Solirubrobacterales bacterium]